MIFFNVVTESIVQVDDMTRIDATKIQVTPDEGNITLVRISPDNGTTWFDVTSTNSDKWFLDWAFSANAEQTIKVEVTTDSSVATEKDYTLTSISIEDDCLFSSDEDLEILEPEIKCYLKRGRCSFLDVHRMSKKIIMDWLQRQIQVKDCDGGVPRKLVDKDLFCKEEIKTWSIYQSLLIIFRGLSNQTDDVFRDKLNDYREEMNAARARAEVTVDVNQDGTADYKESLRTAVLTRY